MTTSRSRGISTSTFFRLCSRAPRTEMAWEMVAGPKAGSFAGASESPGFFLLIWPLAIVFKPVNQLLRGPSAAAIIAAPAPDQSPLFYDRSVLSVPPDTGCQCPQGTLRSAKLEGGPLARIWRSSNPSSLQGEGGVGALAGWFNPRKTRYKASAPR